MFGTGILRLSKYIGYIFGTTILYLSPVYYVCRSCFVIGTRLLDCRFCRHFIVVVISILGISLAPLYYIYLQYIVDYCICRPYIVVGTYFVFVIIILVPTKLLLSTVLCQPCIVNFTSKNYICHHYIVTTLSSLSYSCTNTVY